MEMSITSVSASFVLAAVLILACRVLNWLWLKPKRLEKFLRKQGLPGTSYTFLVGDLKRNVSMVMEARSKPIKLADDIKPRVTPFLLQTAKDYGKTNFTWLGPVPRVAIMEPEQIKEVLNKIYDFQKPQVNPFVRLIATGLSNYDGEKWAKHRKIIRPAFHLEKLKNMLPAFHESCSEMINKWEKLVSDKGSSCEVDVWPYLLNMTSDVISRTAFGSSHEEGRRIFQLQDELTKLVMQAVRSVYIPGWRFVPTKRNKRMKEIDREIRDTLIGIISKKEKAIKSGNATNDDLLGILLESNSEQVQGGGMSIEDVIAECKLFYFAGQEITSVLLVWTIVLLSQHQEWQARAREEVMEVFGQEKPHFDGLGHLKVIPIILYEVLRLYPPAVMLIRALGKETKLGDLRLPPGVLIVLPTLLVHHDRELWGEDALEFKPERFADGVSKATRNQMSYFPFGWGPRICIGQNFALIEAKMALVLILQSFTFELSSSYAHAPCTLITLHPQFGAHLILRKL